MGTACIIEQDAQILKTLETTLKEVDSRLEILSFSDLEGFYKWFTAIINQKPVDEVTKTAPSNNPNKTHKVELKLLMGDIQFLGPHYFTLVEKLRKLMVRRGILKSEEELAILLTAFESPDMNLKQIESRIITNIVFKPFDIPILKQQLKIALNHQKPVSDSAVFTQKMDSTAEMLKEVQLESFTELGFITRSNRELKLNDISKYYSHYFQAKGKLSVLARCISCQHHPDVPGEFQAEFRYFGANNNQERQLRQTLFTIQHDENHPVGMTKKTIPRAIKKDIADPNHVINFLIFLKPGADPSVELKDAIEKGLSNVSVAINRNIALFIESMGRKETNHLGQKPIHAIVLSADTLMGTQGVSTWSQIVSQIEEFNQSQFSLGAKARPKLIISSHHEVAEEKLRAWSELVSEIIYTPLDRPYLHKRFVTLLPEIQPRLETLDILSVSTNEIIRVANPIGVTTISEAILTMKYYRPISFHSFRRFCLPSREGEEKLELLGSCFYSEKKKDHYINHFVFFGITDKYLKYIRKWILERYISSKEGNDSGGSGNSSGSAA